MLHCGFLQRAAAIAVSKSPKPQRTAKNLEADVESEREWPVESSGYEMVEQLGKGAHAAVYYARCKPFDEAVAIKKIDLDSNSNWDLGALERETAMMRKFHHPNILPLYTSFVTGRELWMVMPVMGQGSVRSIMRRKYPEGLDEVVIATIMYQVLLGLEYVHRNGGIHRDIKADNILLSEAGAACLADFGVAATRTRVVSRVNMSISAVMATTFVGTPCWMAPEVMQQEEGYSTSADIWSFGITLMELATGRPPMARVHPMRVLMDTIRNPPPSLEEAVDGRVFSQSLRELVDLCLQKDPNARPSASALLKHRFFKTMARDSDFLVTHFLRDVRPVTPDCGPVDAAGNAADGATSGPFAGSANVAVAGTKGAGTSNASGSFLASGGPNRLKSTWYFPAELQTHQEDEADEEHEPAVDTQTAPAVQAPKAETDLVASAEAADSHREAASTDVLSVLAAHAAAGPAALAAVGLCHAGMDGCPTAEQACGKQTCSHAGSRTEQRAPVNRSATPDYPEAIAAAPGVSSAQVDNYVHEAADGHVLVTPRSQMKSPDPARNGGRLSTSPTAIGRRLFKDLSSSMKALLTSSADGNLKAGSEPTDDNMADYAVFASKPGLLRRRSG